MDESRSQTTADAIFCPEHHSMHDGCERCATARRFELIMGIGSPAYWEWDLDTDELSLSAPFARLLGYGTSESEALRRPLRTLIHHDDVERLRHGIGPVASGSSHTYELELRFREEAGGWRWLRASGCIAHHEVNDRPTRIISTAVDIDRLIVTHLEREARLREELEQAKEGRHMSRALLSRLSHAVRGSVDALLGAGQLLENTLTSKEELEWVHTIQTTSRLLVTFIDEVIDLSRLESGELTLRRVPMALDESLQAALTLLAPSLIPRGLEISLTVDPATPRIVQGDPERTERLLFALLNSATRMMQSGDRAELAVSPVKLGDDTVRIRFAVRRIEDGFRRDHGIGCEISELLARSKAEPGNWLDASIAHRLAHAIGGEVMPGVDGVTLLAVELPFAADSTIHQLAATESTSRTVPIGAVSGERENIVEDNLITQKIVASILTRAGYTVTVASDGAEAWDRLGRENFSLVLMDCELPVIDGFTLTSQIRARERTTGGHLSIVAMTAHTFEQERLRCFDAGMDDFISKPVCRQDLLMKVSGMLRETRAEG